MRLRGWWSWPVAVAGSALAVLALVGSAFAYTSGSDGGESTGIVGRPLGPVSTPVGVGVNGLRVRDWPGLGGPIVGLLYTPDQVRIVTEGPVVDGVSWELVRLSGRSAGGLPDGWQGWVATEYVAEPMCGGDGIWVPWACLVPLGGLDLVPVRGSGFQSAVGG